MQFCISNMYFVFGWTKKKKKKKKNIISLRAFTPNILYLTASYLCYCAVGVKAQKEIIRFYFFCASTNKIHVAKTKHNVKTPDTILLLCISSLPNRFLSLVTNIILGVMSCHDHLRWISSYTLIFSEYPQLTMYTQAYFAISCHAYRFYAHNIADMIMA